MEHHVLYINVGIACELLVTAQERGGHWSESAEQLHCASLVSPGFNSPFFSSSLQLCNNYHYYIILVFSVLKLFFATHKVYFFPSSPLHWGEGR